MRQIHNASWDGDCDVGGTTCAACDAVKSLAPARVGVWLLRERRDTSQDKSGRVCCANRKSWRKVEGYPACAAVVRCEVGTQSSPSPSSTRSTEAASHAWLATMRVSSTMLRQQCAGSSGAGLQVEAMLEPLQRGGGSGRGLAVGNEEVVNMGVCTSKASPWLSWKKHSLAPCWTRGRRAPV